MSLLGLVRHLAKVEHTWFQRVAQSTGEPRLWGTDRDFDFDGAVATEECVDDAFARLRQEVGKAERWLTGVDDSELGEKLPLSDGGTVSIRDLLVHMIEEYARHVGHADLLRECIDGRTGQ